VGFEPVPYPNINTLVFRPVIAGMWTHADLVRGVYSFHDLMEANELLDVKSANERQYQAWKAAREDS
jgi:hypothetical protein